MPTPFLFVFSGYSFLAVIEPGVPLYWSAPFVLLLAAIALMPLVNKHWWENRYSWVAIGLAIPPAIYYAFIVRDMHHWLQGMQDYVSFIILLGSLYVVSGGIVIDVSRRATPLVNCTFLLLGAIVANIFGTTGASMLLIRPFLRVNRGHLRPYHVVFFIFIVSNVGGALTPIGDPPLFLGYLHGVPFWWVLEHCRGAWLLAVGLLLAVFLVIDTLDHRKTPRAHRPKGEPAVQIVGTQNMLFIGVIVAAAFQRGCFDCWEERRYAAMLVSREVLMAAAAVASWLFTKAVIHSRNGFTFGPIKEVAILFVGIFSTMAPALQWLEGHADRLPLKTPGQYYFATGALSSALDNAPTYLTFLQARLASLDPAEMDAALADLAAANTGDLRVNPAIRNTPRGLAEQELIATHPDRLRAGGVTREDVEIAFLTAVPEQNAFLIAISLGAVFFGACTYIGNGPNFMVKSIADSAAVRTPGFLGYLLCYTLPILIPVYVIVWAVFLRS